MLRAWIDCFYSVRAHIRLASLGYHSPYESHWKVTMPKYDYLVDARGEACPMPLLKAKMQLNKMNAGECLKVMATDAGSIRDFSSFIELTPNKLLMSEHEGEEFVYFIEKQDADS